MVPPVVVVVVAAPVVVLLVVATTKFFDGAWMVIVFLPLLILMCRGIHAHYTQADPSFTKSLLFIFFKEVWRRINDIILHTNANFYRSFQLFKVYCFIFFICHFS